MTTNAHAKASKDAMANLNLNDEFRMTKYWRHHAELVLGAPSPPTPISTGFHPFLPISTDIHLLFKKIYETMNLISAQKSAAVADGVLAYGHPPALQFGVIPQWRDRQTGHPCKALGINGH